MADQEYQQKPVTAEGRDRKPSFVRKLAQARNNFAANVGRRLDEREARKKQQQESADQQKKAEAALLEDLEKIDLTEQELQTFIHERLIGTDQDFFKHLTHVLPTRSAEKRKIVRQLITFLRRDWPWDNGELVKIELVAPFIKKDGQDVQQTELVNPLSFFRVLSFIRLLAKGKTELYRKELTGCAELLERYFGARTQETQDGAAVWRSNAQESDKARLGVYVLNMLNDKDHVLYFVSKIFFDAKLSLELKMQLSDILQTLIDPERVGLQPVINEEEFMDAVTELTKPYEGSALLDSRTILEMALTNYKSSKESAFKLSQADFRKIVIQSFENKMYQMMRRGSEDVNDKQKLILAEHFLDKAFSSHVIYPDIWGDIVAAENEKKAQAAGSKKSSRFAFSRQSVGSPGARQTEPQLSVGGESTSSFVSGLLAEDEEEYGPPLTMPTVETASTNGINKLLAVEVARLIQQGMYQEATALLQQQDQGGHGFSPETGSDSTLSATSSQDEAAATAGFSAGGSGSEEVAGGSGWGSPDEEAVGPPLATSTPRRLGRGRAAQQNLDAERDGWGSDWNDPDLFEEAPDASSGKMISSSGQSSPQAGVSSSKKTAARSSSAFGFSSGVSAKVSGGKPGSERLGLMGGAVGSNGFFGAAQAQSSGGPGKKTGTGKGLGSSPSKTGHKGPMKLGPKAKGAKAD